MRTPTTLTSDRLWKAEDVAAFLGVARASVYELVGLLPINITPQSRRPKYRWDPADVRRWVEQRKHRSGEAA